MAKLLLLPESSGYVYSLANEVVAVELEGGLTRSRRDVVGASSFVECQWTLNREDYQYFRAFYNFETDRGASPFTIDLLLDQPYLQEFTAKFVADSLRLSEHQGLMYRLSARLEVVPIYDSDFDEMILLFYSQDSGVLDALEQLTNVDWYLP